MAIPNITYYGRQSGNGLAFVGYPKIGGVELTRERLLGLEPAAREECARDLARFLSEMHSFNLRDAQEAGVVRCEYPFCRTEDGIMEGSATTIYHREVGRLLSYATLDEKTRGYCRQLVERILDERADEGLPEGLVHGDLSSDHILMDPASGRVTGVIDFTDVIINSPLLDFIYLYQAYGREFFMRLLDYYGQGEHESERATSRVELLHRWYTAMRLLWALDHDYKPGINARLGELHSKMSRS